MDRSAQIDTCMGFTFSFLRLSSRGWNTNPVWLRIIWSQRWCFRL